MALLSGRRRARAAAANLRGARPEAERDPILTRIVDGLVALAGRLMGERKRARSYAERLNLAGLRVRPQEYVVLLVIAAVTLAVVGAITLGWPGVLLGVLSPVGGRVLLAQLKARRQRQFGEQMVNTLALISGSMRAAASFSQALAHTAHDAEGPMAEELARVVNGVRMGRDVGEALHEVAQRMENLDFRWVAEAVEIHAEVGGDLADVLDGVAETIREREIIRGRIRALSAEGRVSMYVLAALPAVLSAALAVVSPSHIQKLFSHPIGLIGIAAAVVLCVLGIVVMRKIIGAVRF